MKEKSSTTMFERRDRQIRDLEDTLQYVANAYGRLLENPRYHLYFEVQIIVPSAQLMDCIYGKMHIELTTYTLENQGSVRHILGRYTCTDVEGNPEDWLRNLSSSIDELLMCAEGDYRKKHSSNEEKQK